MTINNKLFNTLVREWHKKFKIEPIKTQAEVEDFVQLRINLFEEEYQEYKDAGADIIGRADAITDCLYVISGSFELMGRTQITIRDTINSKYPFLFENQMGKVMLLLDEPKNKLIKDKLELLFEEVNNSNHSKADGDGYPIFREDGKILKGKHFVEPDLKKVLFYD